MKSNEYIEKRALIEWLIPYVHMCEKVDPKILLEGIRSMCIADVVPRMLLINEIERTGEACRIAAEFERRIVELEAELQDARRCGKEEKSFEVK